MNALSTFIHVMHCRYGKEHAYSFMFTTVRNIRTVNTGNLSATVHDKSRLVQVHKPIIILDLEIK